ncbi:putative mitochondrial cryptochrome DASH [Lachnellula arida]|uniref:Cryptochrome DASH n=1 Tax=Lachnellula arida TaxID=1316785 RepID=A0A8T9BPD4_9HELO|nr:putative mitochondrial cryptochrome DASH [Lachnellula arida]
MLSSSSSTRRALIFLSRVPSSQRCYSTTANMSKPNVVIYLHRRDLRVSDHPVLHSLSNAKDHAFTHLLPLYVFSAEQLEVSGFIPEDAKDKNPYPKARSRIANFWRCGPHRAKYLGESVWDLKNSFEKVGSQLCVRVGMLDEVLKFMIDGISKNGTKVGAVWMTNEEGTEEQREERSIKQLCKDSGVEFKVWIDEKYLIDDRDLPFESPQDLPNIFTEYRKKVEPLRKAPRPVLATPAKDSLPPFPDDGIIPDQHSPFVIPTTPEALQKALMKPFAGEPLIKNPPTYPQDAESAHPFKGGESAAQERLESQIASGAIATYKDTRNGLLGTEYSTKLSAPLVLGSITARQIHEALLSFEDGTDDGKWKEVPGHGKGENDGTKSVRFELLWRDYMRLCNRKFGLKMFRLGGFREEDPVRWNTLDSPRQGQGGQSLDEMIERFLDGTTGMGLIDASQRELFHTGYTSNRARQNVASFLAKHMYIDWRIGAEWYESMLVDYDMSSNWGNWQYLAGVGNDPRGEARIFNPVKQAFEYDPKAEYVKTWIPELKGLTDPGEVFQAWTIKDQSKKSDLGLEGLTWVEQPLKRIEFHPSRKPRNHTGRGRGGGGGGASGSGGGQGGSSRGGARGGGQSRGGGHGGGRYGGSSRGHLYGRGRGGGNMGEHQATP